MNPKLHPAKLAPTLQYSALIYQKSMNLKDSLRAATFGLTTAVTGALPPAANAVTATAATEMVSALATAAIANTAMPTVAASTAVTVAGVAAAALAGCVSQSKPIQQKQPAVVKVTKNPAIRQFARTLESCERSQQNAGEREPSADRITINRISDRIRLNLGNGPANEAIGQCVADSFSRCQAKGVLVPWDRPENASWCGDNAQVRECEGILKECLVFELAAGEITKEI